MRAYTKKFIESQTDEWLRDFSDKYEDASATKRLALYDHYKLVEKELTDRYEQECKELYEAETRMELGSTACNYLDGVYDYDDVGDPSDNWEQQYRSKDAPLFQSVYSN